MTPPSAFGLRGAVLAAGLFALGGCGRTTSRPDPGPTAKAGGSAGFDGQSAGEGGNDEPGAVGGSGRGGATSNGGRAVGGGAGGGVGGGTSGGVAGVASAGAGASGGGGGRSPLADLPLPPGCQAQSGAATELLCGLDVSCDAVAHTQSCYHLSSGAWQCTCEPPHTDKMFLIEGATGLDACAVGAGLCAGSAPDPGFFLDSCVTTREELGSELEEPSCTLELQCERPVAIDFAPGGVRATLPGGGVAHCVETLSPVQSSGQTRVDCETTGSLGAHSYAVMASSTAEACRPVLELYLSSKEPVFDGSKSCGVQAGDSGVADSCTLTETCFDSAPIADSVSLVRDPSERAAFCGFDDLNHLTCGCRFEQAPGEVRSFSYDLGIATRPAACDLSDCALEMRAEPAGPGACQAQEGSIEQDGDDGCRGYFGCSQPATLAGEDVTIYSQLNVRCARANDDAFYCGCAAGDETATYRAGEMGSSVDACDVARTACLTHLALPLGPASNGLPPDPLLGL